MNGVSERTPGLWIPSTFGSQVQSSEGPVICQLGEEGIDEDTAYANARLIATAPALLSAVEELLWCHEHINALQIEHSDRLAFVLSMAKTTVAKAKGGLA